MPTQRQFKSQTRYTSGKLDGDAVLSPDAIQTLRQGETKPICYSPGGQTTRRPADLLEQVASRTTFQGNQASSPQRLLVTAWPRYSMGRSKVLAEPQQRELAGLEGLQPFLKKD